MILIRQQNLQEPKVPDNRNNGAELIMSIIVGREPTINQGDNAVNRSYLEQCEAQRELLLSEASVSQNLCLRKSN